MRGREGRTMKIAADIDDTLKESYDYLREAAGK